MKWLRAQTREKIKYEQKIRKDLRDALTCNESDRKFLLQELARREEVLDELAAAKHGMAYLLFFSGLNKRVLLFFTYHQYSNNYHINDINIFLHEYSC